MKKLQQLAYSAGAFFAVLLTSGLAFAEEGGASGDAGMMALAVALGIGAAAVGGALGQGRAASAALEGIARNPNASGKLFVPMILGLAFIESLVLFTWVMVFFINNKF